MKANSIRRTAILVDGGYYRVRARMLWGSKSAQDRADELYDYCMLHITEPTELRDLYRIFYYDCPPMTGTKTNPWTGSSKDFSLEPGTRWSDAFHNALRSKRKLALRMGELAESTATFVLKDSSMESLFKGTKTVDQLGEDDFRVEVKQKGVDMRIGLDVTSLSSGRYVDQIVLIAGDSDFLPVVKMARRQGVDFILDPMKQYPKKNMLEHVDGIESYTEKIATTAPAASAATTAGTI